MSMERCKNCDREIVNNLDYSSGNCTARSGYYHAVEHCRELTAIRIYRESKDFFDKIREYLEPDNA